MRSRGGKIDAAFSHRRQRGVYPMAFHSILFKNIKDTIRDETLEPPDFFVDLNLDQIIDSITNGRQDYHLKPFFHAPLRDIDAIMYRHEVFRDLEGQPLFEHIKHFAQEIRTMREHLVWADKLYYKYQKHQWFLAAVGIYCDAITELAHHLTLSDLESRGFLSFREYLTDYIKSDHFTSLRSDTEALRTALSTVKYCLHIKGNSVKVRKYEAEADYSAAVERTFWKFKQGAVKDYRSKFSNLPAMNQVEGQILDLVAKLYPDIFLKLDNYCTKNSDYLDARIGVFNREIQFYVAYLEHVAILKGSGLHVCYPQISNTSKEVYDYGGYDLALAYKLIRENSSIVSNDFFLRGRERIFLVSGPNQGGKTTFARSFGQLHYLARLGCPVPGRKARLFLYDRLFTHFEKEENIKNLRGKLQDDLLRVHHILGQATSDSIVITNEIFTSTTSLDAVFLGTKLIEQLVRLDLLCVYVTFTVELASMSETVISMVSTIVPENPAVRTYRIVRRPADGLSYAIPIAEKHQLTYDRLLERIGS